MPGLPADAGQATARRRPRHDPLHVAHLLQRIAEVAPQEAVREELLDRVLPPESTTDEAFEDEPDELDEP